MHHVIHLIASNTTAGNPRRAYVVLFDDGTHAYFDEGYLGRQALPSDYHDGCTWNLNVTPSELKRYRATSNNAGGTR